jgi:hypothetical protein
MEAGCILKRKLKQRERGKKKREQQIWHAHADDHDAFFTGVSPSRKFYSRIQN